MPVDSFHNSIHFIPNPTNGGRMDLRNINTESFEDFTNRNVLFSTYYNYSSGLWQFKIPNHRLKAGDSFRIRENTLTGGSIPNLNLNWTVVTVLDDDNITVAKDIHPPDREEFNEP